MCLRLKQLEDRFIFEKWNILPERFKLQKRTDGQDSEQLEIMLEYVFVYVPVNMYCIVVLLVQW